PPSTTYAVVVDCVPVERREMRPTDGVGVQQLPEGQSPPFTTTLTFPEGGGTQSVFIDRPSDCTVTEAPPPGCTLTSVDPGTTEIRSPIPVRGHGDQQLRSSGGSRSGGGRGAALHRMTGNPSRA